MSLAMFANLLTMMFCFAVLVQSLRMMRSLRTVKDGGLAKTVEALETATREARSVLSAMKTILGTDCAENARLVLEARGLRDELSLMIGIADATAERIVGAVAQANGRNQPASEDGEAPADAASGDDAGSASVSPELHAEAA